MADKNTAKIFTIAAILAGVIVAGLFFVSETSAPLPGPARETPAEMISFTGLPESATLKATIDIAGKVSPMEVRNDALVLSPQQVEDFRLPYTVSATLQYGPDEYRDFQWVIDSRGVQYSIIADGFTPDDKVSLFVNDQFVYKIPFDWSGRISLDSSLTIVTDSKHCVSIEEKQANFGFCHAIKGKKQT